MINPMQADVLLQTRTNTCGAKSKRSGVKCRNSAMPNGKCRMHGGKSLAGAAAPGFKDGKHSKYQYLPPVLTARAEELTGDALDNLEESIKIQRSIETQLLEKLGTGESPDAWNALGKILDADPEQMPPAAKLQAIRTIVDGALGELSLQQRIQSIHDTQRKLTETLSKVRKEAQETYTQEQWNAMLHVVLLAAKKAITEPNALNRFITELDAHRTSDNQQPRLLGAGAPR
jgi:hypothetical protein